MAPDDEKARTYVPLAAGTMVSHYQIVEKIGAGGMEYVYLAEDTELSRHRAHGLDRCQDAGLVNDDRPSHLIDFQRLPPIAA